MEEKKLTDEEIAKAILQQVEYNAGIPYIDEWLKVKTVKFADILNFIYRLQDKADGYERKIENGTLKGINDKLIGEGVYGIHQDTTGKYWFDDDEHLLLGFTSDGIITWNDNHGYNDYFKDGLWFSTREEAEKRLKEMQNG